MNASTTTTSITTLTTIDERVAVATFGLFPEEPVESVSLSVYFFDQNYVAQFFLGPRDCEVLDASAYSTYENDAFSLNFSEVVGGFRRSRDMIRCSWYTHYPAEPAEPSWYHPWIVDARNGDGEVIPVHICMTGFQIDPTDIESSPLNMCGDVDADDDITAGDALIALRSAVGTATCSRCDVDRSGIVTAADALSILKAAVGSRVPLLCPEVCI